MDLALPVEAGDSATVSAAAVAAQREALSSVGGIFSLRKGVFAEVLGAQSAGHVLDQVLVAGISSSSSGSSSGSGALV
jgi:hypothetical protein